MPTLMVLLAGRKFGAALLPLPVRVIELPTPVAMVISPAVDTPPMASTPMP